MFDEWLEHYRAAYAERYEFSSTSDVMKDAWNAAERETALRCMAAAIEWSEVASKGGGDALRHFATRIREQYGL